MNESNNHDVAKKPEAYESLLTSPESLKLLHDQVKEPMEYNLMAERNEFMKKLGANLRDLQYFQILREQGETTAVTVINVLTNRDAGKKTSLRVRQSLDRMENLARKNVKHWRTMLTAIDRVLAKQGNWADLITDEALAPIEEPDMTLTYEPDTAIPDYKEVQGAPSLETKPNGPVPSNFDMSEMGDDDDDDLPDELKG